MMLMIDDDATVVGAKKKKCEMRECFMDENLEIVNRKQMRAGKSRKQ